MFCILSLFFTSGCLRLPEIEGHPKEIKFRFTLTDENGVDLFFGEDAKFNPLDVKIRDMSFGEGGDIFENWYNIPLDSDCFYLDTRYYGFSEINLEFMFLIKFFPDKMNVIRFRPSAKQKDKILTDFDTFFDIEQICKNCDRNLIYKIEIK